MESGVLPRSLTSPWTQLCCPLSATVAFLTAVTHTAHTGSSVLLQAEPLLMNLLFRFHFQDNVLRGDMVHFPVLTPPPPVFSDSSFLLNHRELIFLRLQVRRTNPEVSQANRSYISQMEKVHLEGLDDHSLTSVSRWKSFLVADRNGTFPPPQH